MLRLGITRIPSYEPQGRGRMERVFGTLQWRLPQEMRLAGLDTIEAANAWLRDHYVAAHNAQFTCPAASTDSHFIAYAGDLADILRHQEERVVGNANCVRFQGRILQIPATPQRRRFVAARVRVHRCPNGAFAIFHGPREIARFGAAPNDDAPATRAPAAASQAPGSRPSSPSPAGGAIAPDLTAAARAAPSQSHAGRRGKTLRPTASPKCASG